ncbi:MAG: M1 family metallopeptidase [Bacteroidia bacterium]
MKKLFLFYLASHISLILSAQQLKQANWQQKVVYNIAVELNDQNHEIDGLIQIVYTNNSPNELNEIYIHLWPNAYLNENSAFAKQQVGNGKLDFVHSKESERGYIDQLDFKTGDGVQLNSSFQDGREILKVALNKALMPGQTIRLVSPFHVKIPKVFSRLGHDGQDYFMTQWYPKPAVYDVNGWNLMPYLDQGEFYSEFAEFEVSITLPDNYVLAATGTTSNEKELAFNKQRLDFPLKLDKDSVPVSSEIKKTVKYTASNVHDFAWFASKKFNIIEGSVEVEGRNVVTRIVAYEPKKVQLTYVANALSYYSDKVGPYPYPHATVVHGELKAGGGMEYPMITLCDVMNEEVIVHEVGHNWFYGILANNERRYPWMDESINSFYDSRATASEGEITSGSVQDNIMNYLVKDNLLTNEHQAIDGHSEDFTNMNYGISVYGLGAKAFEHLLAYLGEDVFDQAMRDYFNNWKFKHPLPHDMKESFENSTGKDLDWFFDELLSEHRPLDYKVSKSGNQVKLTNKGAVAAPVPIVFGRGEVREEVWASAAPGESVLVKPPWENFEQAVIDPDGLTIDLFANNDAVKQTDRLKFGTGVDRKIEREMYYLPALAWNGYDKWMAGLLLHNYSFSNKAFQYHVAPLFSFEKRQINGLAKLSWTKALKGKASYLEIAMGAQKFTWSQAGFREFDYIKLEPSVRLHLAKKSMRSPVEKSIGLKMVNTLFSPDFELEEDRQASFNPNYTALDQWQFIVADYRYKKDRKASGFDFHFEIEHGMTRSTNYMGQRDTTFSGNDTTINFLLLGTESVNSSHTKLSATFNFKVDIGISNKPMLVRVFGAYLLKTPEDGYFKIPVTYTGSRGMYSDYRFDELSLYRNTGTGMMRNQVAVNGSNSRFVGILGQSDKMLSNIIVTIPLPGKIPLKPYIEFLTFTDISDQFWNDNKVSFIYNIGVEFPVIPGVFTMYFNLAQSKDINSAQEGQNIDKFKERITFSLNLNELSPPKIKRRITLF